MSTRQKSKGLVVCYAFLFLAGLVGISAAGGELSVLSRLQTIEDPELCELIRVALENLPETKRLRQFVPGGREYDQLKEAEETAKHRTVRLVTEAYVQIKLLDAQISQAEAKLASSNLPGALASELILARADLESQRATKLAELREVMHIIPRHALGQKPVRDLNGWLRLDVIGDSVVVFTCAKPFTEDERRLDHVFVKLMSTDEAMNYAVGFVEDRGQLPFRVDIMRNSAGIEFSEELQKELIRTVKRAKLEWDAEVHLREDAHWRPGRVVYALHGKLGTSYTEMLVPVDGADPMQAELIRKVGKPMDADEFNKYVRGELVGGPEHLPVEFVIRYDERSKDLASQAEGTIRDIAKKHGVDKLVQVTQEELDPEEVK